MDTNKLIEFIDLAMTEIDTIGVKSKLYQSDKEPIISTKRVLNLLKDALQKDQTQINERILRAMHDIGMSSYKDFENTPIEDAICNITELLYRELPYYKNLEPLRMDFGKGNPI